MWTFSESIVIYWDNLTISVLRIGIVLRIYRRQNIHKIYRVSQEECARLRESVP